MCFPILNFWLNALQCLTYTKLVKVGESVIGGMSNSKSSKSKTTKEIDDEQDPGAHANKVHGVAPPGRPQPIQYHPQQGQPQPQQSAATPTGNISYRVGDTYK